MIRYFRLPPVSGGAEMLCKSDQGYFISSDLHTKQQKFILTIQRFCAGNELVCLTYPLPVVGPGLNFYVTNRTDPLRIDLARN